MADSSGRAVAQFVVPKGYTGNIPVTVHGKASQKWGTVSVPVTDFNPSVTVTPELPTAGSVITAEVEDKPLFMDSTMADYKVKKIEQYKDSVVWMNYEREEKKDD